MIQPDRIEAARRTMENQEAGTMTEKRLMLATAMKKLLDEQIVIPEEMPKIDKELQDDILALAELATRARSETERNWRSPQMEIIEAHPPEMPTRFAGQLQTFVRAFMVIAFNETGVCQMLPRHRPILIKLALDSVTKSKRVTIQELSRYDELTTAGLAIKLGFPTSTVRRWLEDLVALGVAFRTKGNAGSTSNEDRWKIKDHYKTTVRKFETIEGVHGFLDAVTASKDAGSLTEEEFVEIANAEAAAAVSEDGETLDFFGRPPQS
jgi:hypothetical protein